MTFLFQGLNLFHGTAHTRFIGLNTRTGVLEHDGGMQGNIGTAPRIGCRG